MTVQEAFDLYVDALMTHDWWFEYSDDHSYWTKGNTELKELRELQTVMDPGHIVWNRYAPEGHRVGPDGARFVHETLFG